MAARGLETRGKKPTPMRFGNTFHPSAGPQKCLFQQPPTPRSGGPRSHFKKRLIFADRALHNDGRARP